jgi:4-hydroxy-tetrahydrodipicolinate reductase
MNPIRLAINGAAGRMGKRLVALASEDRDLAIVAALEFERHPSLGSDAGSLAGFGELGVPLAAELTAEADAVIDFSVPEGTEKIVALCERRNIPLVLATTGLSEAQKENVRSVAKKIPIVSAPSMSLAVTLTMKLAEIAARALANHPGGVDVEIIERHHRFKEDSPSGTALKFGEMVAEQMGITRHIHGRQGRPGQRPRDEIGYHAVRVGDNPGEHAIIFGLLGETVELSVRASSRDCYALGALAAAKFVVKQKPGLYNMTDVLGL